MRKRKQTEFIMDWVPDRMPDIGDKLKYHLLYRHDMRTYWSEIQLRLWEKITDWPRFRGY